MTARVVRSSSRTWIANAPCPGAGTISSTRSRRRAAVHPEARETGRGQHEPVDLALGELPEARVDVAADLGHAHPGAAGSCARRRTLEVPTTMPGTAVLATDQDVQWVRALGDGADHDALELLGREVLPE